MVIEPVRHIIDAWIEQNKTARRKQRQTAMKMYERLRDEHDFKGHYGTVRRYVKEAANRQKEVFMPLQFEPAQVFHKNAEEIGCFFTGSRRNTSSLRLKPPKSDGIPRVHASVTMYFSAVCIRLTYSRFANTSFTIYSRTPHTWFHINRHNLST